MSFEHISSQRGPTQRLGSKFSRLSAHSCWRQWGSGAKSHVSSRLYSGYHVRRFLSQWYHSVSLCHCVIVLLLKGSTRRFCEIELGVGAIQTISPQSCLYGLKFRSRGPLILASFSIQKYNFEVPEVPILIHTFIAFTFTFPPPPVQLALVSTPLPLPPSQNTQNTFPERSRIQSQIRCNQITSTKSQAMKVLLHI